MTEIHCNLNNFIDFESLFRVLPKSDQYIFTKKKIFRRKDCVTCSCGSIMVHNGFDFVRKKGFGKAKVGKQLCKTCCKQHHEDKAFWKKLLAQWEETVTSFIFTLRDSHVSWATISRIMNFMIPCSKGKAMSLFNKKLEPFQYPQDNYLIVNYDEQHPKQGRCQKFRLTLFNYETGVPIAEELHDSKDAATVEAFLRKYLDPSKELVIITDCDRMYPAIFKRIWGNRLIHQKCLLHLNKLIVEAYGKNLNLQNEYNKYLQLDIFYNRKKELKYLKHLLKKHSNKKFASKKEEWEWIKAAKKKFYKHLKALENKRRRGGKNLTQRSLRSAQEQFEKLWKEQNLFPKKARERLKMIKNNWKYFTAFYGVEGCPATNNAIENYYSTSLKTHRKKQLRTERGIENHMKLSALKRMGKLVKPKRTLLEIYGLIALIAS